MSKIPPVGPAALLLVLGASTGAGLGTPLPPTGQTACYDLSGRTIACAPPGSPLGGQDAYFAREDPRYTDHGDGTVSDRATGLMWLQGDSGSRRAGPFGDGRMDWGQALAWVAGLRHAGHADWRLPNAKELQSIVDYTRSPQATGSAAVYVAFGEAPGYMRLPQSGPEPSLLDVHGAGAQRSDPKQGDPADYPRGMGPQGDVRRIFNLVRPVRNISPANPPLPTP